MIGIKWVFSDRMAEQAIHPLQQMSETLKAFWTRFGGRENHGANHAQSEKLEALQKLGIVKFTFKKGAILGIRSEGPARERHHITALKNGGKNWKKNLISLCESCHDAVEGRK